MDKKDTHGKIHLGKYILALLLFGSNGVVASFIGLTSYEIVLLRTVIGSTLLLALFFLSGHKMSGLKYGKDIFFIALSGVAMAADWLFLFEAYATIGVSLGMLINYSGPAIVVAVSPIIFKEKLTAHKIIAILAALLGIFLISGQAVTTGINWLGLCWAVLSAVSYAAMVICSKMSKHISGLENSLLQLLFAALTVIIFVAFKQGLTIKIESADWLPILWLGLINTGAGCYLYFSSIGKLSVQSVAVCGYLEPLSAVLFSAVILGEKMLPLQILGATFIIGGAIFGEFFKTGKNKGKEA